MCSICWLTTCPPNKSSGNCLTWSRRTLKPASASLAGGWAIRCSSHDRLDAQLPPALVAWMAATFLVDVRAVRDLGLRDAKDLEIFQAARNAQAVVMTKDSDFVELLDRLGPPPQIVWVTCGNTTNARL